MSEIFRITVPVAMAALMTRKQLRGAWEAATVEQGATPAPGGVTVRTLPSGNVVVAGRAERPTYPPCPDCGAPCMADHRSPCTDNRVAFLTVPE